ncbi:MAG: helix-turn-helix domain-containing protein [Roseburia sp.]|nr:helix-turn-helix domain-containing protein [Roseburia sp.]
MDIELYLEEVGKRIMERRKKLGMTQEMLGEKSELTTQFVSYAEGGKRAMRPENLMKIANALGVSCDYLLTGDIIDKDKLLLSEKLDKLTPEEVRIVENVIDQCILLFHPEK